MVWNNTEVAKFCFSPLYNSNYQSVFFVREFFLNQLGNLSSLPRAPELQEANAHPDHWNPHNIVNVAVVVNLDDGILVNVIYLTWRLIKQLESVPSKSPQCLIYLTRSSCSGHCTEKHLGLKMCKAISVLTVTTWNILAFLLFHQRYDIQGFIGTLGRWSCSFLLSGSHFLVLSCSPRICNLPETCYQILKPAIFLYGSIIADSFFSLFGVSTRLTSLRITASQAGYPTDIILTLQASCSLCRLRSSL